MYSLLLFSIVAASLYNTLLHKRPDTNNIYRFNLHISIVWLIILFTMNHGQLSLNKGIIFWGTIYGITQVLFFIFKTLAMSSGSVSITTLIGNCSMLLSISASVIIWNEKIHLGYILGLVLLLISIFLSVDSSNTNTYKKYWKQYCILFFILCGSIGIIFKLFSYSKYNSYNLDMMIISTLIMIICFCIISFRNKHLSKEYYDFSYISLTISCGILSCTYNLLNLYLAGKLPGKMFFPCFNGGVIIFAAILSKYILHEQLTARQKTGLLLGTIAVSILGIL